MSHFPAPLKSSSVSLANTSIRSKHHTPFVKPHLPMVDFSDQSVICSSSDHQKAGDDEDVMSNNENNPDGMARDKDADFEMDEPEPQVDEEETRLSLNLQDPVKDNDDDNEEDGDQDGDQDGVDDTAWDNGEILTEEERAHLMTLGVFSRAQAMKLCHRKHLEEEVLEAANQQELFRCSSM